MEVLMTLHQHNESGMADLHFADTIVDASLHRTFQAVDNGTGRPMKRSVWAMACRSHRAKIERMRTVDGPSLEMICQAIDMDEGTAVACEPMIRRSAWALNRKRQERIVNHMMPLQELSVAIEAQVAGHPDERRLKINQKSEPASLIQTESLLNICVSTLGGEKIELAVPSSAAICNIKASIEKLKGIEPARQRLLLGSKVVEDPEILADLGLQTAGFLSLFVSQEIRQAGKEFSISLEKVDGEKLGMIIDYAHCFDERNGRWVGVCITRLKKNNLFGVWNVNHPSMRVEVGDRIVSVNGIQGHVGNTLSELQTAKMLNLVLRAHSLETRTQSALQGALRSHPTFLKLCLITLKGVTISMGISHNATISDLKRNIEEATGIESERQRLLLGSDVLEGSGTLGGSGLQHGGSLSLCVIEDMRQPGKEFAITLEKKTDTCKFGIILEASPRDNDKLGPSIVSVSDGLVQAWNQENPSQQVETGDRIVEVNGLRGEWSQRERELGDKKILNVVILARTWLNFASRTDHGHIDEFSVAN